MTAYLSFCEEFVLQQLGRSWPKRGKKDKGLHCIHKTTRGPTGKQKLKIQKNDNLNLSLNNPATIT